MSQSDVGTPTPMDIDSDEFSITSAPLSPMDLGTPTREKEPQYQWGADKLKVIEDYQRYFEDLKLLLEDVRRKGPVESKMLPKKPRSNLRSILSGSRHERATPLPFGQGLHEYLVQRIVTDTPDRYYQVTEAESLPSIGNILDNLKYGYATLKRRNSRSLSAAIDLGQWLSVAFYLNKEATPAGDIMKWKEWLAAKVGIPYSYARKLRKVAKLLGGYPRFRRLGLSFHEVYERRNQIERMLKTEPCVAKYWQQDN